MSQRYRSSNGCIRCSNSAVAYGPADGARGAAFVGPLCKHGHDHDGTGGSLRSGASGACILCARLSDAAGRSAHRLTHRAAQLRYQRTAAARKTRAVYLGKNPERVRLWAQAGQRKRRARLAIVDHVPYDRADIAALRLRFDGQCAYCGAAATALDHVVPLVRGGDDALHNLVPACTRCNSSKGQSVADEWYPFQPFFELERLKRIGEQYLETGAFLMSRKA